MLYLIVGLFAVAAVLGITILIKWLTDKQVPRAVVYSHGTVAAISLVLLIVAALRSPANLLYISIGLLVTAALGGFYMFYRDMAHKQTSVGIAFVHALLAVSGVAVLVFFVFS
jgi:hypothetical protein